MQLQHSIGNAHVSRLVGAGEFSARARATSRVRDAAPDQRQVVQRQGDAGGATLGEMLAQAAIASPRMMSVQAKEYIAEAGKLLKTLDTSDPLYDRVYAVYWGFARLVLDLKGLAENQETTQAQRQRATDLSRKWQAIQADRAARQQRKARDTLRRARAAAEAVRMQVLYAYRDIQLAGEEPEDVAVGAGNVQTLAEKTNDLLKAINEADAEASGRSVTPLIPVLDNALSVVKLIAGWKTLSGLAAQSQSDIAALQNAWELTTTALGIAGLGKFLPLFGHIGPLLDRIAKGWDRVVRQLQEKNRRWWEAREIMGEKLPHPAAAPGGGAVFNYMKRVFQASEPLPGRPSDDVVAFFDKNREMFSRAMGEVMGESGGKVPTQSSWILWRKVDPDKLNEWVYDHRDTVWRLIYGRGWEPPRERGRR
ncbi:MAG: hypothetical protein JXA09_18195 [Anaerolineae bacterium]|nr:hypothetical protein [Anaerolineae bacterium]